MDKSIMKPSDTQVVVFAGGMGKRIGSKKPKPLLVVGGKTLLQRCVEFFSVSGFEEFVFLLGYGAEEVLNHIDKICKDYKYSIDPAVGFGRLNSLLYALKRGIIDRNKRAFFSYPDDILLGEKLALQILNKHISALKIGIIASVVLSEGIEFPYGIAYLGKEGRVQKFDEKPFLPLNVSVGHYIFEPEVYGFAAKEVGDGEIETSLFPKLASMKQLNGIVIPRDKWVPINTRKELENAEKMFRPPKDKIKEVY